jgi:hypothetical protein
MTPLWHRGTKLKIVSTSVVVGGRVMTARCEVSHWIPRHLRAVEFMRRIQDLGQGSRDSTGLSRPFQGESLPTHSTVDGKDVEKDHALRNLSRRCILLIRLGFTDCSRTRFATEKH